MADLDLSITGTTGREYIPFLKRHLRAARGELRGSRLGELSVALVGDRRMGLLHEQFMGIQGPTDVLTFPLDEDAQGRVTAGEVVVCVPEARRQAQAHGVSVRNEVLLYALHGLLHLHGFDDRTGPAYKKMHAMEDKILSRLGVGRVFHPAGRTTKGDGVGTWRSH